MDEEQAMGPISYLVVEFPGNKMTGEAFPALLEMVDRGLVRILDFRFVNKDKDGTVSAVELSDLDGDGSFEFSVFEGVSSGLIDGSDIADAASVVANGSSAGVLIFENRWATDFVQALRRGGAEVVAAGYIPHDTLAASLDATEPSVA